MTIEFVGKATGSATTGATYTVSLTALTGGSGSAAADGDVVVVSTGWASGSDGTPGVTTAGYTDAHAGLYANDAFDANLITQYKRMTGTPDTSVTVNGANSSNYGSTTVVMVFRGVDPTTPLDGVTVTTATGINGGQADPPSITPTTSGAWILNSVLMAVDNAHIGADAVPPAGYTYLGYVEQAGAVTGSIGGVSVKTDWTSGPFDQGAWTGHTQDANCSWCAASIVLKPDPAYGGGSSSRRVVFMT